MKKVILCLIFFFCSTGFLGLIGQNKEDNQITHEKLYEEILNSGIKFPEVVFAQAVLETGHFKSKLFKEANNLFGMKVPKKRGTLAIGKKKGGYAVFESWISSVNDYQLWQGYVLRNKTITTQKEYLSLLDRIYSTNGKYVVSLKKIINRSQHIFNRTVS